MTSPSKRHLGISLLALTGAMLNPTQAADINFLGAYTRTPGNEFGFTSHRWANAGTTDAGVEFDVIAMITGGTDSLETVADNGVPNPNEGTGIGKIKMAEAPSVDAVTFTWINFMFIETGTAEIDHNWVTVEEASWSFLDIDGDDTIKTDATLVAAEELATNLGVSLDTFTAVDTGLSPNSIGTPGLFQTGSGNASGTVSHLGDHVINSDVGSSFSDRFRSDGSKNTVFNPKNPQGLTNEQYNYSTTLALVNVQGIRMRWRNADPDVPRTIFFAGSPLAVPEPSSAMLAGVGLMFALTRRRRS